MIIDTIEKQIDDILLNFKIGTSLSNMTIKYNGGRQGGHAPTMLELLERYPSSLGLVPTVSIAQSYKHNLPHICSRILSHSDLVSKYNGTSHQFNMVIVDNSRMRTKDDMLNIKNKIITSPNFDLNQPFVLILLQ